MPQLNDTGTIIRLEIMEKNEDEKKVDLSDFETTELKIQKPDGSVVTKAATVKGPYNNILKAESQSGDFDIPGIYRVQGYLDDSDSTSQFHTTIETIEVEDNLT